MDKDIIIHTLREDLLKIHLEKYNTQSGMAAEALGKSDLQIVGNFRLEVVKDILKIATNTGMTQISELSNLINKVGNRNDT